MPLPTCGSPQIPGITPIPIRTQKIIGFHAILNAMYSLYTGIIDFQPACPAFTKIFQYAIIAITQIISAIATAPRTPSP